MSLFPKPELRIGSRIDAAPSVPADKLKSSEFTSPTLRAPITPVPAPLGQKHDAGKQRYDLIPPLALDEFVKVLTVGAKKYADNNWQVVPHAKKRYFAALQRHIWALKRGEQVDPEDGLHHYAHALCCLFFLLEFELDPATNALQTKASSTS